MASAYFGFSPLPLSPQGFLPFFPRTFFFTFGTRGHRRGWPVTILDFPPSPLTGKFLLFLLLLFLPYKSDFFAHTQVFFRMPSAMHKGLQTTHKMTPSGGQGR